MQAVAGRLVWTGRFGACVVVRCMVWLCIFRIWGQSCVSCIPWTGSVLMREPDVVFVGFWILDVVFFSFPSLSPSSSSLLLLHLDLCSIIKLWLVVSSSLLPPPTILLPPKLSPHTPVFLLIYPSSCISFFSFLFLKPFASKPSHWVEEER